MAGRRSCCAIGVAQAITGWGLKLEGGNCNRDANRGAHFLVGGRRQEDEAEEQRRQLPSYITRPAANCLGWGPTTKLDWLEVKWPQPSGKVQKFNGTWQSTGTWDTRGR